MYSTCTLSQIQNMSVVEEAVSLARENHGIHLKVSTTHVVGVSEKLYLYITY